MRDLGAFGAEDGENEDLSDLSPEFLDRLEGLSARARRNLIELEREWIVASRRPVRSIELSEAITAEALNGSSDGERGEPRQYA